MKNVFLLLGVTLATPLYAADVSTYIVNGDDVSVSSYPSFSSLYFDDDDYYGYRCGATVINAEYVLTAAHCVYGAESEMLHYWVVPQLQDTADYLSTSNKYRVKEYYYPDTYVDSAPWPDDIAILKLESTISGNPDYSASLNSIANDTYVESKSSDNFIAIGHGLIEGNQSSSGYLQATSLDIISPSSTCDSSISDKQLCFDGEVSGNYKNSTCEGDSGGPVFWYNGAAYVQIGITSWGFKTCGAKAYDYSSVFTEVYDYDSWIQSVISGGETAKYYVTTSNGTRTLYQTSSGTVIDRADVVSDTTTTSSSGGGGSLGLFSLLALVLFGKRRHA